MMTAITTATRSDQDRISAVLTLAFSADPVMRWVYPDPQQYLTCFPEFVRAFGGKAFDHGTADYAADYVGAALWLPPEVHPDEDLLVALLQHTVAEQQQAEAFALLEQTEAYHPSEPYWYLPVIGVDPSRQGHGYGGALLEHALARCDRDHTVAYLESSNPRNTPLYERHGFEVIGVLQAGASPPLWPMVRKPR